MWVTDHPKKKKNMTTLNKNLSQLKIQFNLFKILVCWMLNKKNNRNAMFTTFSQHFHNSPRLLLVDKKNHFNGRFKFE